MTSINLLTIFEEMSDKFKIPTITVSDNFTSVFSEEFHEKIVKSGMILTDRINAQNLRLRISEPGYSTDWHVAGDATLIIIQKGTLRITLRNGEFRDFAAGDYFIAKDYLPEDVNFDNSIHGHKAEVIGDNQLLATHIKLG